MNPANLPSCLAPRPAPWVILGRIASVSSSPSDGKLEEGDDLAVEWRDPPLVSHLTLRQHGSLSAMTGDFYHDRDNYPSVVAVDSTGALLLRTTMRDPEGYEAAAWWTRSERDGGSVYILFDVCSRRAAQYPVPDHRLRRESGNIGFIAGPHGVVAELQPIPFTDRASLLCFYTEHQEWASRDVKVSHAALWNRPWGSDGVVSHDRKLWWIDLSCGLLFCDPFDDDLEEMQFVALPEGCGSPAVAGDLHKSRCVTGSAGRLRYVHIDAANADAPIVALWSLYDPVDAGADHTSPWTCDFAVAFKDIWKDSSYKESPMPPRVPVVALVDPTNAAIVYFFQITARRSWMFSVDLCTKKTLQYMEYSMPNVPRREHSSRFVQAWELPLHITRHDNEGSEDCSGCTPIG